MEAKATQKYLQSSPRKMRLVVDLVRGLPVEKAINILHFQPKHASKDALKVVKSATSNLLNKMQDSRVDVSDVYIKEAYVNQGPTLKRISPAPMGRAYKIKKRSCHVTITVATKS